MDRNQHSRANGQIVADPNGGFDVLGTHIYTLPLSGLTFSVVVGDAGGELQRQPGRLQHRRPSHYRRHSPPPLGTTTFNRVPLLTFTDADPFVHFTATVSWGDGTTSVLGETTDSNTSPIVLNVEPGAFVWTVYGSHTYTSPLSGATFSVQVSDNYGSTAVASDTDFTVEDTPPAVTSINCASNQLAPGTTSLQFDVTFNEAVTGLTASDSRFPAEAPPPRFLALRQRRELPRDRDRGFRRRHAGTQPGGSRGVVDDFGTPMGGFGRETRRLPGSSSP